MEKISVIRLRRCARVLHEYRTQATTRRTNVVPNSFDGYFRTPRGLYAYYFYRTHHHGHRTDILRIRIIILLYTSYMLQLLLRNDDNIIIHLELRVIDICSFYSTILDLTACLHHFWYFPLPDLGSTAYCIYDVPIYTM